MQDFIASLVAALITVALVAALGGPVWAVAGFGLVAFFSLPLAP